MKKFLITIGIIIMLVLVFRFRFNIHGFYHEVIRDDIVDLGGDGLEEIHHLKFDDEGNLYVLSISSNESKSESSSREILVTKIDDQKNVVWSKSITDLNGTDISTRGEFFHFSHLSITEENDLIFTVNYVLPNPEGNWVEPESLRPTEVYRHVVRVYDNGKKYHAVEFSKEDKHYSQLLDHDGLFYFLYDNSDAETTQSTLSYITLDHELTNKEKKTIQIEPFYKIKEAKFYEDHLYLFTSTSSDTENEHKIQKISLQDETFTTVYEYDGIIEFTLKNDSRFIHGERTKIYGIERENIEFSGYDFKEDKELEKQTIQLDWRDHTLQGIYLSENNALYFYGYEHHAYKIYNHTAYYEQYDENGKFVDDYKVKIPGEDRMMNLDISKDGSFAFIIESNSVKEINHLGSNPKSGRFTFIRYED